MYVDDVTRTQQRALVRILRYRREASSQLDRTYLPVLDRLLMQKSKMQREQIIFNFRRIVGSIVCLAQPLAVAALSALIRVKQEDIYSRLTRLHSVLDVPGPREVTKPIRGLHLSFRDYLTDPDNSETLPFYIEETITHRTLIERCLDLLTTASFLKKDIFDLRDPGSQREDVANTIINAILSPEMQYACSFWTYHFQHSKERFDDSSRAFVFLQDKLIFWVEAVSWLGRASELVNMIDVMISALSVSALFLIHLTLLE